MSGESYTIKELSQITGYSTNTIRGYIKGNKLKANLVNGKYQIDQAEAERFFKVGNQAGTTSTTKIDTNFDTNLVTELKDRIHQLESDKAFLQKQILDLQETIKMLTIRKLPGYQEDTRGVLTRVKEWLVGKKEK
ncbi:MAG TPA: helix-turn-helix domain-containing protein [Atribacter sp.]|uniref:helix-turn-helix domain-containing protein n=1 Tax=Atribacter sp. TaxID=2847780 RepID=UPI002B75F84D|nr:helix-turn-helix domain-containing protein [Atribacter sp.]HQK83177.1 helix-turn-helix domain-containing protein [Atribacter sp.]